MLLFFVLQNYGLPTSPLHMPPALPGVPAPPAFPGPPGIPEGMPPLPPPPPPVIAPKAPVNLSEMIQQNKMKCMLKKQLYSKYMIVLSFFYALSCW